MGSDEERFAFEVMRQTLGLEVEPFDDGSQPRMVDGRWRRPDGSWGAVEVRRAVDPADAQLSSLLYKIDSKQETGGLRWWWMVRVEPTVRMRDFTQQIESLLAWCEGRQVSDLGSLRWSTREAFPLRDYVRSRAITAWAMPKRPNPGYVTVLETGQSGVVADHDTLVGWVESMLVSDELDGHMTSLRDADAAERHLFVPVSGSGPPPGVFLALTGDHEPPASPSLACPRWLDALWLLPVWQVPLWLWRRDVGWSRQAPWNSR